MFLKNKIYLLFIGIICYNALLAQVPTLEILEQGRKTSIRGMSVVNNNVIWVSGSSGSVGKSLDGGKTWNWITVAGYEKSDFRDIEAFDDKTALIMGITQPAVILKTKDGGLSWRKVFEDTTKEAFFDAMAFTIDSSEIQHNSDISVSDPNDKTTPAIEYNRGFIGMFIGDPINNQHYVAFTENEGDSWELVLKENKPETKKTDYANGEAFFASSGTNITWINFKADFSPSILAVSGGIESSLIEFPFGKKRAIPLIKGKTSTGANSIAISKKNKGVIVGGDFANDTLREGNMVLFNYGEKELEPSFLKPTTPPHGYRSCVIYIDETNLITCGTSGVDISKDGGINWELISNESFHVVQKAKNGNAVFLAGKGGRIAKFNPIIQ